MRILLIDDNPDLLECTAEILENNRFEVVTKTSGREAKKFLKSGETVDLIISDIDMPDINGYKLLNYTRNAKHLKNVPVILCSGMNDGKSVVKGVGLGADDYIIKPFTTELLIEKIQKVLDNAHGAVLVVENEPLLSNILSDMLKREGFRVVAAASAREALEIIDDSKVALILSDIAMPEFTGMDLLRVVKAIYPYMPVVLIIDRDEKYSRQEIYDAGADALVAKPFINTEILNRIKALLE